MELMTESAEIKRPIKILDGMGVIRAGYHLVEEKPDRTGLVKVVDDHGVYIKINPKRIRDISCNGSLSVPVASGHVAACPVCSKTCEINDATTGVCTTCGTFTIAGKAAGVAQIEVADPIEVADQVDLDAIVAAAGSDGELWAKAAAFDDADTKVVSYAFRFKDKHISFNIYNGTFGKKGKKPPIGELIAGNTENCKGIYMIKTEAAWREKLADKGYKKI